MPYIYENDVTQTGGNLQKTVAYLLSLHKNEYEWNLLGIKVVGHVDALPIPDSDYQYGDAYMVGTATPYDMWIYTRADATHPQDYWFNVGKFPAPGPQGPAGPSLIDVTDFQMDAVQRVDYDATTGADVESAATLKYKDPNTGEPKEDTIDTMKIKLPILPGKYISMDANADNNAIELKVDNILLALDYYHPDKDQNVLTFPAWDGNRMINISVVPNLNSIQDNKTHVLTSSGILGESLIPMIKTNGIRDGNNQYITYPNQLAYACSQMAEYTIIKTDTDTGTLNTTALNSIKNYPQLHIIYDNQVYYRYDPLSAPEGTLNFIHLDTLQDGEGGYKVTGKCFSVTVSTRAWQVVDIDFGGTGVLRTTHNLTIDNTATGNIIYLTLVNSRTQTYEQAANALWTSIDTAMITCTVDTNGKFTAGVITTDGDNFKVTYGEGQELLMTQDQINIADNMA